MWIGNLDVFLESMTIKSACNKVLRKRFLQPDTIGLIPTGGYTCKQKLREEGDDVAAAYGGNGRSHWSLVQGTRIAPINVDGYCPETGTIYEFFGCYFHGHTYQPFRDVITTSDGMSRRCLASSR